MIDQSEILSHSQVQFITFFLEAANCVASFTSHGKVDELSAEKLISWAKPAHFDFFTVIFFVWSDVLNTGGVPVTSSPQTSPKTKKPTSHTAPLHHLKKHIFPNMGHFPS